MYIVYKVSLDPINVEMAQALLGLKVEMDGVMYGDDGFSFYVPGSTDKEAIGKTMDDIGRLFPLTYTISELEDKNWNAQWESDFKYVEVRNYCRIRAPFHDPDPSFDHDIIIHPGMAFGTGHHETTWQMADAISKLELKDKKVLDAGCGTGVLAILAAREGASHVDAFDYDIHSVESSELNKGLNHVKQVNVSQANVEEFQGSGYDVIVANINRNVIISGLKSFGEKLNYKGMIIASGYLVADLHLVEAAAAAAGLKLRSTSQRGEWMCQVYALV